MESTTTIPKYDCVKNGHRPMRVIADNGFTYEIVCRYCGTEI